MIIALIPALLLTAQHPAKLATLKIAKVGMAFSYPKTWKETGKKKKDEYNFDIPVAGTVSTAKLTVYSVIYSTEQSDWELGQQQIADQMKRQMVKQSQEQLLGVPLLLAKTAYDDRGTATTALSGLLFSATPRKLVFRLVAPSDAYDAAEFEFRAALQSLHTINGAMPASGDPVNKPEDLTKRVPPTPKVTDLGVKTSAFKVVPGPVVATGIVASKPLRIRLPKDWTASATAQGFSVKSSGIAETIDVGVFSSASGDLPENALIRASGRSLDLFKSVTTRTESVPAQCVGGATVSRIWRRGTGANGPLATCDAGGQLGDYFWIVTFVRDGKPLTPSEQKLLNELIDTIRVELAP